MSRNSEIVRRAMLNEIDAVERFNQECPTQLGFVLAGMYRKGLEDKVTCTCMAGERTVLNNLLARGLTDYSRRCDQAEAIHAVLMQSISTTPDMEFLPKVAAPAKSRTAAGSIMVVERDSFRFIRSQVEQGDLVSLIVFTARRGAAEVDERFGYVGRMDEIGSLVILTASQVWRSKADFRVRAEVAWKQRSLPA